MATLDHNNPCPRGHDIYNFGTAFPGYHYHILGLSDLCLGVKKKILSLFAYGSGVENNILKEMMHLNHMANMATPYYGLK